jgi:hypothetical protein
MPCSTVRAGRSGLFRWRLGSFATAGSHGDEFCHRSAVPLRPPPTLLRRERANRCDRTEIATGRERPPAGVGGGTVAPDGKRKESREKREPLQSGVRRRQPSEAGASQAAVPRGAAEDALAIEQLLNETSAWLAQTAETPLRRELTLLVERYRRALREWPTQPPTQLQRDILIDCVKSLHRRVASRSFRKPPHM